MTDVETLSERVRTVERAVTDGEHSFPEVDELAELTERLDGIERQLDELEERTAEVEAATQALRGYVGNVRSVNDRVEQRADTALAATERLEQRLDDCKPASTPGDGDVARATRNDGSAGAGVDSRGDQEGSERPSPAVDSFEAAGTDDVGTTGATGRDRPRADPTTNDSTRDGETGVLARIRSLL